MMSVFLPCLENHKAVAAETVVFPTPPLPPIKTNVVLPFLNLKRSLNAIF